MVRIELPSASLTTLTQYSFYRGTVTDGDEDDIAGLRAKMSSFPKSSQGAYCAVVNHVPKLSRTAAEQILADYEGYAASGTQSTYKKAQKLAVRFGKFKTSRAGRQLEAQQVWLRTPVTRLDAPARSTTPSTTPLPVAGVKHGRPPSSPTTSNANGVHNRVTPNKAPHKKTSAGRGVGLADPVRRTLDDPPRSPAHIKT